MGFLDAIIIYLASGSPFAVYRIAVADRLSPRVVGKSVVYMLFWPVSAMRFVAWHLPRVTFQRKASLQDIRDELEALLIDATTVARLRFRDVFDRYVSLQTAGSTTPIRTLLDLTDHSNIDLAEVCGARRMRNLVDRHIVDARDQLIDSLRLHSVPASAYADLLLTLSQLIADPSLETRVSLLHPAHQNVISVTATLAEGG